MAIIDMTDIYVYGGYALHIYRNGSTRFSNVQPAKIKQNSYSITLRNINNTGFQKVMQSKQTNKQTTTVAMSTLLWNAAITWCLEITRLSRKHYNLIENKWIFISMSSVSKIVWPQRYQLWCNVQLHTTCYILHRIKLKREQETLCRINLCAVHKRMIYWQPLSKIATYRCTCYRRIRIRPASSAMSILCP